MCLRCPLGVGVVVNEPDNAVFRMARIELCKRDIQEMAKVAGLPPLPPHGLNSPDS